ncbi:hypothetical protein NMY22_g13680 [Coprinellus aureogranulatus]|nr:hypothetical protein NMY22_g13680 [Coprinellus aureogranulatus]
MATGSTAPVPTASFDASRIAGNAPLHVKQTLGDLKACLRSIVSPEHRGRPMFATQIFERLKVTEISIERKRDEESKSEGRFVMETVVGDGAWYLPLTSAMGGEGRA